MFSVVNILMLHPFIKVKQTYVMYKNIPISWNIHEYFISDNHNDRSVNCKNS